uniref:WD repeat domain, phosphoinositide interacting 1 n=1 Tax=Anas platyrhynchos platyrhynchos TaxID=8840 RepID=A0A493TTJ5_ANAPP
MVTIQLGSSFLVCQNLPAQPWHLLCLSLLPFFSGRRKWHCPAPQLLHRRPSGAVCRLHGSPKPPGLCALSINHANSYLAYPGSATSGEIALYDGNTLKTACTIPAHDGPLAALTFNSTGSKLASASEKGTVIRVFSIPGGQKLYEFRRGMKRYVNISSLVFSMDSQFLCASSNTETVHIFKLEHLTDSRPEEPPTWSGYMGKMFQAATNYLPAQVSGMINQDRAFATVRLNTSGQRNVCALSTIQKLPRLLVTTSDGHLYIYNLDPQDGGECVLIKKHSLLGSGKTEENKENDLQPPVPQSYAATVARQSTVPSTSTMPGYSEDGGALRGEVIPEHEFATGPVCLDDENEFPPCATKRRLKTSKLVTKWNIHPQPTPRAWL